VTDPDSAAARDITGIVNEIMKIWKNEIMIKGKEVAA
jgi:hypothetical protein